MLLRFFLLGLSALVALNAQAAIGICGFYGNTYQSQIRPKVQAGVPFELMSVILADDKIVEKKAVRIAYNLWDEIITVKSGDQVLARIKLADGEAVICKSLEMDASFSPGHKYFYRLLLNPLWAERITRLQVASAGAVDGGHVVGVNWQKIANEMPSERVLLERVIAK